MNFFIKRILTLILVLLFSGLLGLFSWTFGSDTVKYANTGEVWNRVSLQTGRNGLTLEETAIDKNTTSLSKNTPVVVNYARLVDYIYLSREGVQKDILEGRGSDIFLSAESGIISLYDIFVKYRIHSNIGRFQLEQVTNGSFYIGHDQDGKISIYSIDGVGRLTFLDQDGVSMTNMMLFPGSYIRFDPSRNSSLRGADLFRIITTLDIQNNEVFEFVNPRVNTGEDRLDTFFNYRLPGDAKVLFQILSTKFSERINTVNLIQTYGDHVKGSVDTLGDDSNFLIVNDAKKNHTMMLQLNGLLAQMSAPDADVTSLIPKIAQIYDVSKKLDVTGVSAKNTIEQFLLDGRFAFYSGNVSTKYHEMYEQAAKLIGIQIDAGNSKFLQNLSNIYSQNLFIQNKTGASANAINTYAETSLELMRTVAEDKDKIQEKDYFDIAIYAYNILAKMEDSPKITYLAGTMNDSATYNLISTFLYSANLYITSIQDSSLRKRTISSIASKYLDHLLYAVSQSLYAEYTVVNDGKIYLSPAYLENESTKLPDDLRKNMDKLTSYLKLVAPTIQDQYYEMDANNGVAKTLKASTLAIHGFTRFFTLDYREYVQDPYLQDPEMELPFPKIDKSISRILQLSQNSEGSVSSNIDFDADPGLNMARSLFPNISENYLTLQDDTWHISKLPVAVARSNGNSTTLELSARINGASGLSGIELFSGNMNYTVVSQEFIEPESITFFIKNLDAYLTQIESYTKDGRTYDVKIFPLLSRIGINGQIYAVRM